MKDPKFKAEFGVSRLIRYNGKRQLFFDGLHRITLFTNAVLGSAAFVAVISDRPWITAWLTAIVAIASAADNVIGFSEKARVFREQRIRYYDLYSEIVSDCTSPFNSAHFQEKRLRIDRDSPPTRRILDVISRNEEEISRGWERKDTIYIGPIRYALRHIYDLPPTDWITCEQHDARRGFLFISRKNKNSAD